MSTKVTHKGRHKIMSTKVIHKGRHKIMSTKVIHKGRRKIMTASNNEALDTIMSTKVIHKGRGTIALGNVMHIHNGKDIVLPKGARIIPTGSTNQKPHILLRHTEYKHCSYCDTWYTLDEFWAHADHWDGLQHHCKGCVLEQNRLSLRRRT